jgi:hypothetical protein
LEPSVRRAAAAIATLLGLVPGLPRAATLRVPAAYGTIQDGVTASNPGDTVLVASGTYTGPGNRDITFGGKSIVLRSENGPAVTVLDVQGNAAEPHRGVVFQSHEGPGAVLEGFQIINGYMSMLPSSKAAGSGGNPASAHDYSAGGVRVQLSSSPTIRDCIIRSCYSQFTGGGMSIEISSSPLVTHCTFVGCTSGIQGGGISIETVSEPTLVDCVVTGNHSKTGGGIAFYATATVQGCVVSGNTAERGGGIECIFPSAPALERCIVWGNCATLESPEIHVDTCCGVSFTCCILDSTGLRGPGKDTQVTWGRDNVFTDPLFCAPRSCSAAPTEAGDYRLAAASSALPENSPCGRLLGPLGRGCDRPDTAVLPLTWSRLKGLYRAP